MTMRHPAMVRHGYAYRRAHFTNGMMQRSLMRHRAARHHMMHRRMSHKKAM